MTRTVLFLCSGNYYRSRFAELVFNHRAEALLEGWVASSAGLLPEHFEQNRGPISRHVMEAARDLGIALPDSPRPPHSVTEDELARATLCIALKEAEHRPLFERRFPAWADRVTYWHIHDVDLAPPSEALPAIEAAVAELIGELVRRS